MAKSSREMIMKDELRVLNFLEQHAKESIDEIAKQCGFSRQKVWRIIKHLEEDKIIWGYAAITSEDVKNLKHFVLLLKRTMIPFDDATKKEVIKENLVDLFPDSIKNVVEVENIYFTHGKYDSVVTFYAPNLVTAKKVLDAISQNLNKYFEEYLLLETLFPVRKQGLKNPQIKILAEYI
jgi:DNA-binding Lrp family transcriptional regulator